MKSSRTFRLFTLMFSLVTMLALSACIASRIDRETTTVQEPTPTEPAVAAERGEGEPPASPARFQIESIDVDAEVEHVEQDDRGRMDVPQEWENVAWYELGPVPGEQGNAVIAGHYDSFAGPAVFFDLNKLEPGDRLRVVTEDGEELEFEITEIESVHIDDADSGKIFGDTDEYNLNLVTCEGIWDPQEDMYDHRLIIYSTLVTDETAFR